MTRRRRSPLHPLGLLAFGVLVSLAACEQGADPDEEVNPQRRDVSVFQPISISEEYLRCLIIFLSPTT